ncbi:hypothetical protein CRX72_03560 [Pantoea sp. BRM17]|nr:hypothetical protein CRX72_03560 [Pantoea sp. BRM17]
MVEADERVLKDMGIQIGLNELAASSLNFVVRCWSKSGDLQNVYWDLMKNFKRTLDAHGIGIPYPQVMGTVQNVQIFSTTLKSADGKMVVVPNGKIIASNIVNFSREPIRRNEFIIGVAYDADVDQVIDLLRYGVIAFTIIAALGRVGVQTASVIAVLGAAGLAVGLALQGSLSNLAAGVLLVTFRPFRTGEFVDLGGGINSAGGWLVRNQALILSYAVNIVAAIAIIIVGMIIARIVSNGVNRLLVARHIDATVADFLSALVRLCCANLHQFRYVFPSIQC